jgi:hypothetical protein
VITGGRGRSSRPPKVGAKESAATSSRLLAAARSLGSHAPKPIPTAYKLATEIAAIQGSGKPRVIKRSSPHTNGGVHARHERDHGPIHAPAAGAMSVIQARIPTGAPSPKIRPARPTARTKTREVNTGEG